MSANLLVRTMLGLGDCIASRPTIAALLRDGRYQGLVYESIYLETPWPEVFADFAFGHFFSGFVRPSDVTLRAQKRNVDAFDKREFVSWSKSPTEPVLVQLSYKLEPGLASIPRQIADSASVAEFRYVDLFFPKLGVETRMGIFRLPTIRREYHNPARNPARGLVVAAIQALPEVEWLHVNDIHTGGEELPHDEFGELAIRTAEAAHGQFSMTTIFRLVAGAAAVVAPVSYLVWLGIALRRPTLAIWGGFASPGAILGEYSKAENLKVAEPVDPCYCYNRTHNCGDARKMIDRELVRKMAKELVK